MPAALNEATPYSQPQKWYSAPMPGHFKPIEELADQVMSIRAWCIFPAGGETRRVDRTSRGWYTWGVIQNVTHYEPGSELDKPCGVADMCGWG